MGRTRRASPRAGFSLVEMTIVLVLAGFIGTAALTMITANNRLNNLMTSSGRSQENARSAVTSIAAELRPLTAGSIVEATARHMVVAVPLVLGIVCGVSGDETAIHFMLDGTQLADSAVDGLAVRESDGDWDYVEGAQAGLSPDNRSTCQAFGGGTVGADSDYRSFTLQVTPGNSGNNPGQGPCDNSGTGTGNLPPFCAGPIGALAQGQAVMLFQLRDYAFAPSALQPDARALHRGQHDEQLVELAYGFGDGAGFAYRLTGGQWLTAPGESQLTSIDAIRIDAEVVSDPAGPQADAQTFSLVREVPLRNAE